ncbi:MAG: 3,8-cyclase [Solirubrobacteraceae bacterium]|nr:3,8-cyclase [Solirubrobacteraceae bacterium]
MRDLRISVTDRCNMRCRYCMPREVFGAGHRFLPRDELLSFEEIARVAAVLAGHGVRKIRLTGGEPLLRRGLENLVAMLASIDGIEDLSLTTNGLLLARRAQALADAGLNRVTVSLDALDPATLHRIADAPVAPERILDGIEAATDAGLGPVKVNMVVRRGVNDGELIAMANRFRHSPQVLRFIEYMDVGSTNGWRREHVVPAAEMLARISARWPLEALPPTTPGEVATRYRYADGAGEIGVIHAVTAPFCHGCTRARLSADGRLYTCLFATGGHDLRELLRAGAEDPEIAAALAGVWAGRSDRYSAERSAARPAASPRNARRADPPARPRVEMSYIGG